VSHLVSVLSILFFIVLLSQFGKRIAARKALLWWGISLFLIVAAVYPKALIPVAAFLGITLVSNLVIATVLMFLILQVLQESAESTTTLRKLRLVVSALAARDFMKLRSAEPPSAADTLVICPCYNESRTFHICLGLT
jgi:hypothetical protein